MRKRLRKIKMSTVLLYVVMIALAVFMLLPLVYLTAMSVKPLNEIFLFPPTFFAKRPTLTNFVDLFSTMDSRMVPFTRYIFNSLLTTAASVIGAVLICAMGAYAVEKVRFFGADLVFRVVVLSLMFSVPAAQIPIYIAINRLGIFDTYLALILPNLAVPVYFFLFKQFISQIPNDIIEAAYVDGLGYGRIFTKMIMPLIKPAISTVVVLSFIANWNNSNGAAIYITDQTMKTIPYALSTITSGGIARAGVAAAATFLITLPSVVIYLLMQKKVMDTMAYAGIKG